jgi:uncharacterized protein YjiS (DUF1127 family)
MNETQFFVSDRLTASIDELYRTFGAWKTARALARAVLKRRRVENQISHLSNRMLRDIGLPEREDVPGEGRSFLWDIWV